MRKADFGGVFLLVWWMRGFGMDLGVVVERGKEGRKNRSDCNNYDAFLREMGIVVGTNLFVLFRPPVPLLVFLCSC